MEAVVNLRADPARVSPTGHSGEDKDECETSSGDGRPVTRIRQSRTYYQMAHHCDHDQRYENSLNPRGYVHWAPPPTTAACQGSPWQAAGLLQSRYIGLCWSQPS